MSQLFAIEQYTTRADWLRGRKSGLGASDAPVVLGMSRFQSAYGLATDKLTEAVDDDEDETAEWGRRHEPAIAKKFAEVMSARGEKFTVNDPGDFTIFRSTERNHLFCTPDRLNYHFGVTGLLVAETSIKCSFFDAAKEWAKAVPLANQIQAQHTMYVLGVDTVYYAVLLNGCSFKWHTIRRNEKWIARMLPRLDAFWAAVQRGEYPNVDAAEATARALARRYPTPTAGHVELPNELTELGDEYDQILADASRLDERKTLIQNIVKEAIGNQTTGVLADGTAFAWNSNGKGRRFTRIKKKIRKD